MKLSGIRDKDGNIISAKLDQFIKEHKGVKGDPDAFDKTVRSMAGKSSEVHQASSQDDDGD